MKVRGREAIQAKVTELESHYRIEFQRAERAEIDLDLMEADRDRWKQRAIRAESTLIGLDAGKEIFKATLRAQASERETE